MRSVSIIAVCTAAFALAGCPSSDTPPPDTDKTPTMQAPRVPVDFQVEDSVDAKKDQVDYKILQPPTSGKAKVEVELADGHQLQGSAVVYGSNGTSAVEQAAITPDESSYTIEWDVAANALYYLKVEATNGKAPYKVNFSVTEPEPVDPCAGVECGEDEECQAGKCVEVKPPECEPKCKSGLVCVNGSCEKPCGGGCPKGQLCSRAKNECVKDPCFGKQCAAGEKCVSGVCKATTAPTPTEKECKPACAAGQTCNKSTGKCEGEATPPPVDECAGPLNGSIVQVLPQGAKTVLVINRGSKVCVKVGQTGKINGVAGTFKVTEVYEFRCKAVIDVDDKTIGANRSVTINR